MPETIDTFLVDGISRSRTNALGEVIDPSEEGLTRFWRWFGNSKAVDKSGRPLIVFHGSKADFDVFDLSKAGVSDPGLVGSAIYFSPTREQAQGFAESKNYGKGKNPIVFTVYLKCDNPAIVKDSILPDGRRLMEAHPNGISTQTSRALNKTLKKSGYDSVLFFLGDDLTQAAVFSPKQIKSIDNHGLWNKEDERFRLPMNSQLDARRAQDAHEMLDNLHKPHPKILP